MTATRTDQVTVPDGTFDLHVWTPDAGRGPGLVLVQEIFGVGAYIRAVGERLAQLGYVVGAPDVFWRLQRNWAADHDEAGLAGSFELVQKLDPDKAVADAVASVDALDSLAEVDGRPGIIGFCLGGTIAWQVALADDPSVAVSYYGSGVPSLLDDVAQVRCPVVLHFGGDDAFIPVDGAHATQAAVADQADIEVHVHAGAGHAFDNHEAPMFHQPDAADEAWNQTTAFLNRYLPVS